MKTLFPLLVLLCVAVSLQAADVVADGAKLEKVATGLGMPDGPAWDGKLLWFPDVPNKQIMKLDPATGKVEVAIANTGIVSATFMDSKGRLLVCEHVARRISRVEDGKLIPIYEHAPSQPPRNPNDLTVDHRGGIYHTSTATNEVWYTTPDGKSTAAVVKDVPQPNGIALSPDDKTLYVSAYGPKKLYAYDVGADGSTGPGKVVAEMTGETDNGADGMKVDSAGNIFCTGPHNVWVWDPAGKLLTKIDVPEKPINCTFGDADLKSLYITAGHSIYRIKVNVAGLK